jgi:acetyl esterase/lipase
MDDTTALSLVRFFLPHIPYLVKTALWHSLGISPTSHKWDLKTELRVNMIRKALDPGIWGTISRQQAFSLKDGGIKGRMWVAKVTLPAPPEDDILTALVAAIDSMKSQNGGPEERYAVPRLADITAEWTGYRANVDPARPRPDLSEARHYDQLMNEVSSEVTILYFHGGAFFLCDPSTHRGYTAKLAKLTRGRCLSVRYRLSPQHAFPSALLDCFLAYLSLLSPPPGSFHTPVDPSKIVLCGDSAGGNLALSLLQLLLHLNRCSSAPTIRFHDREVPLRLPAGVATGSAWNDLTRCMPSATANIDYDYILPPKPREEIDRYPACDVWPTDPGRGNIYCDTSMLCHPLVSPVIAPDWRGSCPLWFSYGEEALLDDGKMLAARAARQGVPVVWEEWEAMPHVFAQILTDHPAGKQCFDHWAAFCTTVVEHGAKAVNPKGLRYAVKTLTHREIDVRALAVMTDEELQQRMRNARDANDTDGPTIPETITPKL